MHLRRIHTVTTYVLPWASISSSLGFQFFDCKGAQNFNLRWMLADLGDEGALGVRQVGAGHP